MRTTTSTTYRRRGAVTCGRSPKHRCQRIEFSISKRLFKASARRSPTLYLSIEATLNRAVHRPTLGRVSQRDANTSGRGEASRPLVVLGAPLLRQRIDRLQPVAGRPILRNSRLQVRSLLAAITRAEVVRLGGISLRRSPSSRAACRPHRANQPLRLVKGGIVVVGGSVLAVARACTSSRPPGRRTR